MSTVSRLTTSTRVFERQCDIGMANLARIYDARGRSRLGDCSSRAPISARSTGPSSRPNAYRNLFQPFHRRVNDWIHRTRRGRRSSTVAARSWRCCPTSWRPGSTSSIRCSARPPAWTPQTLKEKFGDKITFWGGGVDTQKTLPFGTPEEVRRQVRERMRIFGPGGGSSSTRFTTFRRACRRESAGALPGRKRFPQLSDVTFRPRCYAH